MLGVILGLTSALGFGTSGVFARLGLQYVRPTAGTLVSLVSGTTIITALAFAIYRHEIFALFGVGTMVRAAPMGDPTVFLWFFVYGVVTFAIARLLNYTGISLAGVSRASPIVGSNPLFATVLAVTIAGESINSLVLLGTTSIIGGLVLILSQR